MLKTTGTNKIVTQLFGSDAFIAGTITDGGVLDLDHAGLEYYADGVLVVHATSDDTTSFVTLSDASTYNVYGDNAGVIAAKVGALSAGEALLAVVVTAGGAISTIVMATKPLIEATIGASGVFASVQAAITAGWSSVRVVDDVTEPADVVITAAGLTVSIDQGKTWDLVGFNINMDSIAGIQSLINGLGTVKYSHTGNSDELFINAASTSKCKFFDVTIDNSASTGNNTRVCDFGVYQEYKNITLKPTTEVNSGIHISVAGVIDGLRIISTGAGTTDALKLFAGTATNVSVEGVIPATSLISVGSSAVLTGLVNNGDDEAIITIDGGSGIGFMGDIRGFEITISNGGRLSDSDLDGASGSSRVTFSGSDTTVINSSWKATSFTDTPENIRIVGCKTEALTIQATATAVLIDSHYTPTQTVTMAGDFCGLVNSRVGGKVSITGDYNSVLGGSCGDLVIGSGTEYTVEISGSADGNTVSNVKVDKAVTDGSGNTNPLSNNVVY